MALQKQLIHIYMKKVIREIPYSRLYKLEVPRLAKKVIEIIERHNPEELLIKEVFDLLVAEKPHIDALNPPYGPHPITEQLSPFRRKLLMYASSIRREMSVIVREDELVQSEDVKIAKIFIDSYLINLGSNRNEELICEKVDQFFMEIDKNEELEIILTTLDLSKKLDNLRSANATLQELLRRRLTSTSQRPKEKTDTLVNYVCEALHNMFLQIKVAQLKNKELDYLPLINELNEQLNLYRNLINIRDGYNKRKAEQKKGIETEQPDETTEAIESTELMRSTESTNGMHPTQVEVEKAGGKNGTLDTFSEQKNAAMSTSKTKPDISSTEG